MDQNSVLHHGIVGGEHGMISDIFANWNDGATTLLHN